METCETRRMGASAEEILGAEFEAAQDEFDRATENPDLVPDTNIVRRYIGATERLRKFLTYGEVPADVAEKLARLV
jgi:hypothetical protein